MSISCYRKINHFKLSWVTGTNVKKLLVNVSHTRRKFYDVTGSEQPIRGFTSRYAHYLDMSNGKIKYCIWYHCISLHRGIALLSIEQLSSNKTKFHQPETESISSSPERNRGCIIHTNHIL